MAVIARVTIVSVSIRHLRSGDSDKWRGCFAQQNWAKLIGTAHPDLDKKLGSGFEETRSRNVVEIISLKSRKIKIDPKVPDCSLKIGGYQDCPQFSSIFRLKILKYLTPPKVEENLDFPQCLASKVWDRSPLLLELNITTG